jgi:DNA repair exonuclease SbcCD nuclease subunit
VSKPYLLVSDLHCHDWSAFATRDAVGHNSRLAIILKELERAAHELHQADGKDIVIAGDLFHVRGQIDPEVFNPVYAMIKYLAVSGFHFYAIPGNHDLKSKDVSMLGNAFQSLEGIENFTVVTSPKLITGRDASFLMIPWMSNLNELRKEIKRWNGSPLDLIIHAGINGVIKGMPDHALEASELADYGFKRVFAGHYHNHKTFCDDKVISIGATTHQTWSDVGSKAGFLLVYPDYVQYNASHAPAFIDLAPDALEDEIPLIVDGNYVRVRGLELDDKGISNLRDELMEMGALGFVYQGTRAVEASRPGGAAKATTLDESVGEYIGSLDLEEEELEGVMAGALDILTAVRGVKEPT